MRKNSGISVKRVSLTRRQIHCEAVVDAPAPVVWGLLVDAGNMPSWSTGFHSIAVGEPPAHPIEFKTKAFGLVLTRHHSNTTYEAGERLGWSGRFMPGIYDNHQFAVVPIDESSTRLVQTDEMSGPAIPVLGWVLLAFIRNLYPKFNRELKAEAERLAGESGEGRGSRS